MKQYRFSIEELKKLTKSLVVLVDSREMNPAAYMASLKTWEHRFGTNVQFIDKQYSGYYIVSTFQYFAREALK